MRTTPDLGQQLLRICEMTDAQLRALSPADRDRMLQIHLAAARGPRRNLAMLCRMTDSLAPVRRELLAEARQK